MDAERSEGSDQTPTWDGGSSSSGEDPDDEDDDGDAELVAARKDRAAVRAGSGVVRGQSGGGTHGEGGGGRGERETRQGCGVVVSPSDIEELLKTDEATRRK